MSYIFWKLLLQRLILAIKNTFWASYEASDFLLTQWNAYVNSILHCIIRQIIPSNLRSSALFIFNIIMHFCRRLVDAAQVSYFSFFSRWWKKASYKYIMTNTLSSSFSSSSSSLRHGRWSNLGGCPTTTSSHPLPLLVAPHYPNFIVASTIRKHHKALLEREVNMGLEYGKLGSWIFTNENTSSSWHGIFFIDIWWR